MTRQNERVPDPSGREIRLEGTKLFAATGLLLVALVTAFYLGRWSGRSDIQPISGDLIGGPRSSGEQEPLDVTREAGVFDEVRSEDALEPGREARSRTRSDVDPGPTTPTRADGEGGPWQVQVFAGRDRTSAESLVKSLRAGGYDVRMTSDPEGRETLYKVRVVGYADRAEADAAAKTLRGKGHGAWVVPPS